MKQTKSFKVFYFLIVSFLLCNLRANADDVNYFESGNFYYQVDFENPSCVILSAYGGDEPIVNIPETVSHEGKIYSVNQIGNSAFIYCISEKINIPSSITTIGDHAFESCEYLTSITIPESVESIGLYAFYDCISLSSIELPNSLTVISANLFSGCVSLTSVTIPESVNIIQQYAFDSCTSLTSITIPKSVEHIFQAAFFNCTSLMNVYSLSTVPPYCYGIGGGEIFYPECETAILHVPVGTKEKYEETAGWSDFKTIIDDIPLEDAGIDDILLGKFEGNFEIYSIDGKLITKNSSKEYLKILPKGIYIIGYGKNRYKISI